MAPGLLPVTAPTAPNKTHLAQPSKRGLAARFVRRLTTANTPGLYGHTSTHLFGLIMRFEQRLERTYYAKGFFNPESVTSPR
jgi:hypothetical protein